MVLDDVSRVLLSAACVASAVAAVVFARRSHPVFGPHCWLIAGASIIFACGMLALADILPDLPNSFATQWLNYSATLVVAGWALLVWRVMRVVKRWPS